MTNKKLIAPPARLSRRSVLSGLAMAVPLVAIAPAALAVEPDPIYALIEAHREASAAHLAALDEQNRLERRHDYRRAERVAMEPCHAECRAFEALIDAPPVTFPGLVAWATYLDGLRHEDPWKFEDEPATNLVGTLARSLGNLEMQSRGSVA